MKVNLADASGHLVLDNFADGISYMKNGKIMALSVPNEEKGELSVSVYDHPNESNTRKRKSYYGVVDTKMMNSYMSRVHIKDIDDKGSRQAYLYVEKKTGETILFEADRIPIKSQDHDYYVGANITNVDILTHIPASNIKFTNRSITISKYGDGYAIVYCGGQNANLKKQYNVIDIANDRYLFNSFVTDLTYVGNGKFKYKYGNSYQTKDLAGNISTDDVITQQADMWGKVSIGGTQYYITRKSAYRDDSYTLYSSYNYSEHEFVDKVFEFDTLYASNNGKSDITCGLWLPLGNEHDNSGRIYMDAPKKQTITFAEKEKDKVRVLTSGKLCLMETSDAKVYLFDSSNNTTSFIYKIGENGFGKVVRDFWHRTKNGEIVFAVSGTDRDTSYYSRLIDSKGKLLTTDYYKFNAKNDVDSPNRPLLDNGYFFAYEKGSQGRYDMYQFDDSTKTIKKHDFGFTPKSYHFFSPDPSIPTQHNYILDDNNVVHTMDAKLDDVSPKGRVAIQTNKLVFIKDDNVNKCYVCTEIYNIEKPDYEVSHNGKPYYPKTAIKLDSFSGYKYKDFLAFIASRLDENTGDEVYTLFCTNGTNKSHSETPNKLFSVGEFSNIEFDDGRSINLSSDQKFKDTTEFEATDKNTGDVTRYCLSRIEDATTTKEHLKLVRKRR